MTSRPNVLLIQADQFRADCLGVAGNPDARSPNLDRLAEDGVRYRNAFCPVPLCTPSRYSLLSGLAAHQHGAWSNHSTLAPGLDTFPKALRRNGYRTTAIGKMHFTPTYLDVGYDRMELAEQHGTGRYDDDYHRELAAVGHVPVTDLLDQEPDFRARAPQSYWATYGAGRSDLPERWHTTTWIGDRAVREVGSWSGAGGHLLHVSFVKPHHPFDPPAPWDEQYDPNTLTLLPGWTDVVPEADLPYESGYFSYGRLSEPTLRRIMAHYYATISQLDHQVGRILDTLRRLDAYENTLVIFTADHGEYLGFHHLCLKHGPLYDPVVKVPLLLKPPGGERAGEVSDALVSLTDIAPTVLAACGVSPDPPLPGLDLYDEHAGRPYVVVENQFEGTEVMIRTRTHKLLLTENAARDAFFDLAEDPHELDNRATDPAYAGPVGRLRDALCRWVLFGTMTPNHLDESAPLSPTPNAVPYDEARRGELRALFEARLAEVHPADLDPARGDRP